MSEIRKLDIRLWIMLFISVLIALCYAPNLATTPFWDDISHILVADKLTALGKSGFSETPKLFIYYRPLEMSLIQLNRILFGDSYAFIIAISVALHILSAYAVYFVSLRVLNGQSRWAAFAAGALYLTHPITVAITAQIDTVSEHLASTATILSVLIAHRTFRTPVPPARLGGTIALALTALVGFFAKESFLLIGALLPFVILLFVYDGSARNALRQTLLPAALIYLALLVYLLTRYNNGYFQSSGDGRYSIHIGLNVLTNIAMILGGIAAYMDISAVVTQKNIVLVALGAVAILAPVAIFLASRRSGQPAPSPAGAPDQTIDWRAATSVLALLFASFFPISLLGDVSEHNTAVSTVIFTPILTIVLHYLFRKAGPRIGTVDVRTAYAAWLAGALVLGITTTGYKASAAYITAHRVSLLRAQTASFIETHDLPTITICLNAQNKITNPRYSIFYNSPNDYFGTEAMLLEIRFPGKKVTVVQRVPGDLDGCDLWY